MTENHHLDGRETTVQQAGTPRDRLYIGVIIGMLITMVLIAALLLINARVSSKIFTILLLAAAGYVGISLNRMVLGFFLAALGTAIGLLIV